VGRNLRERHAEPAPAVTPGRQTPRGVAAATPATRDRYADFLRVASMLVVVLGHWLMTAVAWDGGRLAGTNVLAVLPGLWVATWVFQVMPVFFVVGGFANLRAVDSLRRGGGGYVEFLTSRAARLLRPVGAFVAVWIALPPLLALAGAPQEATRVIAKLLPQPLWFLATYLVVVALAPPMVRLHRRFGPRVLGVLAVAAALVDAARFSLHQPSLGYLNLVVVWLAVHQLGFLYADGTLARWSRGRLLAMAAAGLGALALLVGSGAYPPSMVTLPGATESNMNPPTVCMLALAVWQVALVMLARGPVTAWLTRARVWAGVVAAGSLAMTVYLWQMTALVALLALVAAFHLPLPTPGTAGWWLTRPLWLAALAALLAPLALAFARWERPAPAERPGAATAARPGPRAGSLPAALLGLTYAVVGLFGFVTGGFAPLPDPAGSALLWLRVDPLQSAACLALGVALLRAARTGAAATPAPWRWTAVVCAVLLSPAPPGIPGTVARLVASSPANTALHGAALALALWFAISSARRARKSTVKPVPWTDPRQARSVACPSRARGRTRGQVASRGQVA
jgi:peptidoglycan/LPS O-acetylase OafA/YrhL